MSITGTPPFGRTAFRSPPQLNKNNFTRPEDKSVVVADETAASRGKERHRLRKLAVGVGLAAGALGYFSTPAGAQLLQEVHAAECVGLSGTEDLVDLSLESASLQRAPAQNAPAETNRQWWNSLSKEEQSDALENHPVSIGNRDGLPTVVRDKANRERLQLEKATLKSEQQTLEKDSPKLSQVNQRLTELGKVESTLDTGEERYLISLDTESGPQTYAAVAIGNPDTAQHVSVTAPGVNSDVEHSFRGMVSEASGLRKEANSILAREGRAEETVSTIAWMGYDPPQLEGSFCQKVGAAYDVVGEGTAEKGAGALSSFYRGIVASHDSAESLDLTAIGHSYGSLTTSLALQNGHHAVDNLVVYGSPGLSYDEFSDLGLQKGHAYEMTAAEDNVAQNVSRLHWFGRPTKEDPNFIHMSTEQANTPEGPRERSTGHAEYPRRGDNGLLRTSGYNIANVIAGSPQNVIRAGQS